MIRKILLFVATALTLFGGRYDEFLLETQLSLLPKIALLEKSQITQRDIVDMIIVYNPEDEETAKYAANFVEKKFQNKIGKYQLRVSTSTFNNCCPPTKGGIIYCLDGSESQLARIQNYVRKSGSISAVYDSSNLKNGFLFSVILERSPVILMNKKALKEQQFDFPPNFYTIVRPI